MNRLMIIDGYWSRNVLSAYDIYFIVKHYQGGIQKLAEEFQTVQDREIVLNMNQKFM